MYTLWMERTYNTLQVNDHFFSFLSEIWSLTCVSTYTTKIQRGYGESNRRRNTHTNKQTKQQQQQQKSMVRQFWKDVEKQTSQWGQKPRTAPLSKNAVSTFQIPCKLLFFTLKDSWKNNNNNKMINALQ